MNRNAGIPGRILLIFLMTLAFVIISGCGTKAILPTYMQPELLYLKEEPYKKLYVEVDIVEGTEVPDAWLDTLKEFLSTHCSKPDGIEIAPAELTFNPVDTNDRVPVAFPITVVPSDANIANSFKVAKGHPRS